MIPVNYDNNTSKYMYYVNLVTASYHHVVSLRSKCFTSLIFLTHCLLMLGNDLLIKLNSNYINMYKWCSVKMRLVRDKSLFVVRCMKNNVQCFCSFGKSTHMILDFKYHLTRVTMAQQCL